jgi:hypothetical protein
MNFMGDGWAFSLRTFILLFSYFIGGLETVYTSMWEAVL